MTKLAPWAWLRPPAEHQRRYAQGTFWQDRTLGDWARLRAESHPDTVVFPNDPARPTYASLLAESEALCVSLAERGLRQGDVLSFQVPNWSEAATINLAAALGGFVINPIVPIYRDAEVRQMLADSGAKIFFYPALGTGFDYAAMIERIRPHLPDLVHAVPLRDGSGENSFQALVAAGRGRSRAWPQVDPNAVKLLLYTSGTTGRPKGVLHSHNSLARVAAFSFAQWGLGEGDAILMPSPITHISGYSSGLEQIFLAGTRCILMERWNADVALDLIDRYRIAGTVAATPFLKELADAARARKVNLPSLRVFACGGAAVPADLVRDANAAFARPCAFRVYGASEVPLVTLGFPPETQPELAAATDGAAADYEIRLLGESGEDVLPGAEGEILVRGPAMFMGYADEAQTQEAITQDGYFRTGDIGLVTADGAVVITGRKKDLIIRGGENISAKEIEDVLLRHPSVQDAAIVAMPHARLGEGVCAFIVARQVQPSFAELVGFIAESGLAKQKYPERIEFIEALPRTASGKVRKDLLRETICALVIAS